MIAGARWFIDAPSQGDRHKAFSPFPYEWESQHLDHPRGTPRARRETWMNRLTGFCSRRTTISGSVPCASIPPCSPLTRKKLDHSSIPISPASSKERPRSVSAAAL